MKNTIILSEQKAIHSEEQTARVSLFGEMLRNQVYRKTKGVQWEHVVVDEIGNVDVAQQNIVELSIIGGHRGVVIKTYQRANGVRISVVAADETSLLKGISRLLRDLSPGCSIDTSVCNRSISIGSSNNTSHVRRFTI